jgi:hypothetical protein
MQVNSNSLTIEDHGQFKFLDEIFWLFLEAAFILDVELKVVADLLLFALV